MTFVLILALMATPLLPAWGAASSRPATSSTLVQPKEIEEMVSQAESSRKDDRAETLRLLEEHFRKAAHQNVAIENRAEVGRRLSKVLKGLDLKDPVDVLAAKSAIVIITRFGTIEDAREVAFGALDGGPDELRRTALRALVAPGQPIPKTEVVGKLRDAQSRGIIRPDQFYLTLHRLDPKGFHEEIRQAARATQRKEDFVALAPLVQAGDDATSFDELLSRVEELGLKERFDDRGNGLFWIDKSMLAKAVSRTNGEKLRLVLDVIDARGGELDAVVPQIKAKNLIDSEDAAIRTKTARLIRLAAGGGAMTSDEAGEILLGRLQKESSAEVKKALTDELSALNAMSRHSEKLRKLYEKRGGE